MKRSIIFASMGIAAGIVLANIYTSMVDVPAWGNNIPASLDTARQYYKVTNPGNFFRIFSPLNQGLGLLCLLAFWKQGKKIRILLAAAFILYAAGEAMTFGFFYPRNAILFNPAITATDLLQNTWEQWRSMNWVRTVIIATGFYCSSMALHYSYTIPKSRNQRNNSISRKEVSKELQG